MKFIKYCMLVMAVQFGGIFGHSITTDNDVLGIVSAALIWGSLYVFMYVEKLTK